MQWKLFICLKQQRVYLFLSENRSKVFTVELNGISKAKRTGALSCENNSNTIKKNMPICQSCRQNVIHIMTAVKGIVRSVSVFHTFHRESLWSDRNSFCPFFLSSTPAKPLLLFPCHSEGKPGCRLQRSQLAVFVYFN